MNRRMLIAVAVIGIVGGGLAAPALAAGSTEGDVQKVCVKQATVLPYGYCIVWDDPLGQDR